MRFQFAGGWVFGIRNMFDGTSLKRDRTLFDPVTGAAGTLNLKTQWFDTLTGRIGYAVAPAWLIYGQGGVAWANSKADLTFDGVTFGDLSNTRTGWTAGGGVEWMFARGWSAFLEGNYMDFGSTNRNLVSPVGTVCEFGCGFNTKTTATTVLVGVNYRFNLGKAPY